MGALAACGLLAFPGDARAQSAPPRDLVIDGEFGYVGSVAVDTVGRIYVADVMTQQLHVFDGRGARLPSVGRRGHGPGEFQGVVSVVAGRGDTLYTFDAALQRITAFSPGVRSVAYTVQVPRVGGERASYQLLVPSAGPFLLPFAEPHGRAPDRTPQVTLRTVNRRGDVGERPLSRGPDRQALEIAVGEARRVGPLPYGRAPGFAVFGDRVYHGWSGSADVPVFDLRGRSLGAVRTGTGTLRVDEPHVKALLDSYPPDNPSREAMRQAVREGRLPSTKPAWKQMLVDDRGRLWINVVTSDDVVRFSPETGLEFASLSRLAQGGAGQTPWWVYAPQGRRVTIYMLPNNVSLAQVRDGKAYGVEIDADGVQRVVRFAVGN